MELIKSREKSGSGVQRVSGEKARLGSLESLGGKSGSGVRRVSRKARLGSSDSLGESLAM